MQYVSGSNIRAGQIPSLPASLDPIKDWFKALPVQNTVYYIAGGVMREWPGKMNMIWGGEGKGDTGIRGSHALPWLVRWRAPLKRAAVRA
jgi:hypothetical protein